MLRATVAFVPPPAGLPSPLLWGTEEAVRERLGDGSSAIHFERHRITFEFPFPPAQVVDAFRLWYGPTVRAFGALDVCRQSALHQALERLWTEHNEATDGTTRVESEYLEVVAVVG
jgi:hypothetical protein